MRRRGNSLPQPPLRLPLRSANRRLSGRSSKFVRAGLTSPDRSVGGSTQIPRLWSSEATKIPVPGRSASNSRSPPTSVKPHVAALIEVGQTSWPAGDIRVGLLEGGTSSAERVQAGCGIPKALPTGSTGIANSKRTPRHLLESPRPERPPHRKPAITGPTNTNGMDARLPGRPVSARD